MPWAVPEEEKQPRVLDLISALSENCLFPICLKVRHGCGNGIKNTALCVKGLAALKSWFFWAVNGFDDSSCGFSLTLCVVILGCYLVFIPNPNQARESPTLPGTSPPLRLELTKMATSRCCQQGVREKAQPEMCLPQSMGTWVPGPATPWKPDLGDVSVIPVLRMQKEDGSPGFTISQPSQISKLQIQRRPCLQKLK